MIYHFPFHLPKYEPSIYSSWNVQLWLYCSNSTYKERITTNILFQRSNLFMPLNASWFLVFTTSFNGGLGFCFLVKSTINFHWIFLQCWPELLPILEKGHKDEEWCKVGWYRGFRYFIIWVEIKSRTGHLKCPLVLVRVLVHLHFNLVSLVLVPFQIG